MYSINSRDFVAWLTTQFNSRGSLYLERVAKQYARYLRTEPPKLDLPISAYERDVFLRRTPEEFNTLVEKFVSAPNYKKINTDGHQSFSSGLKCFSRYLEYLSENDVPNIAQSNALIMNGTSSHVMQSNTANVKVNNSMLVKVDFENAGACSGSSPVSCVINGANIPFVGNWRDLVVAITEHCIALYPEKTEELKTRWLSNRSSTPYFLSKKLLSEKPAFSGKRISNGYWINVRYSIPQLIAIISGLLRYCGVSLNDVDISYVPKTNGGNGETSTAKSEHGSARFAQQSVREAFCSWLVEHNPEWSKGMVLMHYSDAYYLYDNERGITLEEAITTEGGLQRAYDAIERYLINNPTQASNPSFTARNYLRSLRMLKEFIGVKFPELLNVNSADETVLNIPDALIDALNKNYSSGFRFDTTYINLLSNAAGVEVDEHIQAALKRIMFRREDGIYFLLDTVADVATRKEIIDFADVFLEEYGCFEIEEFYKLYEDKVNQKCIGNADEFESFYEQIGNRGVRCVAAPQLGNRIARFSSGSVWGTFKEVAAKIVSVITEEYFGSCNEDDLHSKFCAFSRDLLGKIIKYCAANELICVEINDSVCYQTFDALGLPDDFSGILAGELERLLNIGLEPTQDILHTAISLKLGVNFKAEFNLPDWDTYRRLVAAFYKDEPRREWKRNIFVEVTE